jgi:membrane AbrB-like protein
MRPRLPKWTTSWTTGWTAIRRLAETLAIGAVGGIVFHRLGLPAGLVSGSIVAASIASLMGRPLAVPHNLTRVVLVIVGIALGSVVTPETLQGLTRYPVSIAILSLAIPSMTAATFTYLSLVHGWNPLSALLGASPGALAQIIAMGTESGADVRGVVVVQTVRVLLLAVGIPLGFAIAGIEGGTQIKAAGEIDTTPFELAVLVAVSVASAIAMYRIGFSGGLLFGAMIGAAALNGSGLVEARLPWWLASGAMISMGAVTGSRLARIDLHMLLSYLLAALGSVTVAVTVASCFIVIAAMLVGAPPADLVVAFSPGAQDTMMLLALALHLDPVFVGAHHLARYVIVSVGVTAAANVLIRRIKREDVIPGRAERGERNP